MKSITVGPCRSLGLTLKFSGGTGHDNNDGSDNGSGGGIITAIHPSCPFRHEVKVGDLLAAVNGVTIFSPADVRASSGETRVLAIFPNAAGGEKLNNEDRKVVGDGSSESEASSSESSDQEEVGEGGGDHAEDDLSVTHRAIEECSSLTELDRLAAHYEEKLRRIKGRSAFLRSRCTRPNCNEPSACPRRNLCKKHGKMCKVDGCTNWMRGGGLCQKHGGTRKVYICSTEGCTNKAQYSGKCAGHAPIKPASYYCKIEGCTKSSTQNGVCVRHGAKYTINRCKVEGCDRARRKGGVCIRHGAKTECKVEGCTLHAQKKGVCARHMTMMMKEGRAI